MIWLALALAAAFLVLAWSWCRAAGRADERAGYKTPTPGKRSEPKRVEVYAWCNKCGWAGIAENQGVGPTEWHLPHPGCPYSAVPIVSVERWKRPPIDDRGGTTTTKGTGDFLGPEEEHG